MHGQRILPWEVAAAPPAKHLGRKTKVSPSSPSLLMPAAVSVLLSKHHVYSLHDVVLCWVIPRQRGANQASRTMESVWRKQHSRLIFARDLQNGGNCFSVVVQQMSDVLSNLQTTSGVTPATFLDPCGPRKTHVLVYHNEVLAICLLSPFSVLSLMLLGFYFVCFCLCCSCSCNYL